MPPRLRALRSDGRRPVTEDFGVCKILPACMVATYFGKVLDCAHADRGRVYWGDFDRGEMGESDDYGRLNIRDYVFAVSGLANIV